MAAVWRLSMTGLNLQAPAEVYLNKLIEPFSENSAV